MGSDDWKTRQSWTVAELLQTSFPPLNGYLNKKMFLPGTVSMVTGPPGVGKSFLGLKLADCISTGTNFAGMPVRQGQVCFVSEEMTAQEMQPRVLDFRMVGTNGHLAFRFQQGIRLNLSVGMSKLQDIVTREQAGFVILDAFSDCHTAPEASNDIMKTVMASLRDQIARRFNCHVCIIHHSGKDYGSGTGSSDSRGAIAIEAVCSDILVVKRDEEGGRFIKFKKVRHGMEPDPLNFALVQTM